MNNINKHSVHQAENSEILTLANLAIANGVSKEAFKKFIEQKKQHLRKSSKIK